MLKDIDFNIETNSILVDFGDNSSKPNVRLAIHNIVNGFEVTIYKKHRYTDFQFTDIEKAKKKFIELFNGSLKENKLIETKYNKFVLIYE